MNKPGNKLARKKPSPAGAGAAGGLAGGLEDDAAPEVETSPAAHAGRARFRPGRRLIAAAAGLLAAALMYFVLLWSPLFWASLAVATGLAVVAVREGRDVRRLLGDVEVRRTLPVMSGRGLPFTVTWEVTCLAAAAAEGELRDVVPADAEPRFTAVPFTLHGGRTVLTQTFRIVRRGRHRFGPVWIRLRGRGGWIDAQREYRADGVIRILPEQFASREELLKDKGAEIILSDKPVRTRRHGTGTEFESLTEFRDGDDPRRIDWRATARHGRPIVRRFQIEQHRDVMIVVDCGRLMGSETERGTKLDRAVDAALILARTALKSGDRCGMATYDDRLRTYLPPVTGLPYLKSLTEGVFAAQSEFLESDFGPMFSTLQTRQSKRSLVVVISDVVDVETSEQFRSSLGMLARRHVVLFAALRTPALSRVLKEPVVTMLDGARQAVVYRLLREREQAVQTLRHAGVHVLDIEPNQLTVPLVNQFIELRQRNLA